MKIPNIKPLSEITKALYLSSYQSITEDSLKNVSITHIINVTEERECVSFEGLPNLTHTKIAIRDSEDADILRHLDTCADKIDEVEKKGGRTLVHCVMGISRSATVCIAYMMKYHKMTLRAAYYHVKGARSVIYPNLSFWAQMVEYEELLYGKTTVEMLPYDIGFLPDIMRDEQEFTERWALRQSNVMLYVLMLVGVAVTDVVPSIFWYIVQ